MANFRSDPPRLKWSAGGFVFGPGGGPESRESDTRPEEIVAKQRRRRCAYVAKEIGRRHGSRHRDRAGDILSLAAGVRRPEIASGEKAEGPGGGERRASATSPASACSTINRSAKRTASPPPAAVTRVSIHQGAKSPRACVRARITPIIFRPRRSLRRGASRKPALLLLFSRGESQQALFPASLCLHPWEPRHGPTRKVPFRRTSGQANETQTETLRIQIASSSPDRLFQQAKFVPATSPIVRCGKRSYNLSGDPTTTVLRGEVVCAGRCDGFMCSGSEICKGGETRGTRDQRSDGHSEDRK